MCTSTLFLHVHPPSRYISVTCVHTIQSNLMQRHIRLTGIINPWLAGWLVIIHVCSLQCRCFHIRSSFVPELRLLREFPRTTIACIMRCGGCSPGMGLIDRQRRRRHHCEFWFWIHHFQRLPSSRWFRLHNWNSVFKWLRMGNEFFCRYYRILHLKRLVLWGFYTQFKKWFLLKSILKF